MCTSTNLPHTSDHSRTGTPAQQIRLIEATSRAVLFVDMRCDNYPIWMAILLGASMICSAVDGHAEKPKSAAYATEWQKGKRLAPQRQETLRLCAGTTVRLTANSAVEVQTRVPLPTSIEGLGPFAYAAQLTSGRIDIDIDIKQRPANGVLIYGPRRTTVLARGGRVSLIAGPSSLAVGMYTGKETSIGIGSTWKHISAGSMLVVSAEAPSGVESKLPGSPARVQVNRPVLAVDGAREPTFAVWDPVAEAKRYLVTLDNTENKQRTALESREPRLALNRLAAGRYELHVSAIEATGLDGSPSPPAFVNVVGLELPKGSFISEGKVYLEALQQVTLTNVEGLEATYDGAPVYFNAANRAGLRGTRATTLHLRVPGSSERVSLDLLPRALHTQVEILPALARWPRDKVVVRIQLPKALADAPSIQLVPSLTVNNQVVDVEWVRSEQSLETVIPAPPSYPGPWVLRAEVADQHGIVLGHNFLEIASMSGLDDEDIPREVHRGAPQAQAKR